MLVNDDDSKEIPITLSVDDLNEKVNGYMNNGTVKRVWVRRALDFLCGADLADKEDDG